MGCCSKSNRVEDLRKDSGSDDILDDFTGPLSKRSCRDIPCLLIFLLFIGGMVALAYLAVLKGNPYRFIYGVDSWGNTCNVKNTPIPNSSFSGRDMTGLSKQFYFNKFFFAEKIPGLPDELASSNGSLTSCVSACPNETIKDAAEYNAHKQTTKMNLCRPGTQNYVDDEDVCPTFVITPHVEVLNRCVPKILFDSAKNAFNKFGIDQNTPQKIISDIQNSYQELLILVGISFFASFLIVILLRFLAAIVIWTLVFGVALLSLGASGYCWYEWYMKSEEAKNSAGETDEVKSWLTYSIISTTVATVVLLVLLVLRKRIGLVVQLFKEAGKAIGSMPVMLLMPIFTLILLMASVAGLAIIAVFMETSGDPHVLPSGTVEYRFPEMWNYLRWYHLFGILWISAFITACQDIAVAGAVAQWFFTRDKKELKSPICTSIGRLVRYHLGSVAFGSFIIALVRLARIILGYIQSRLKGKAGKITDILLKILQCCLCCFERFLRFLNRNAYIEIAIYGYSFCSAAKKAFSLILQNVLRVAAINSIGTFVLFLGKLSIVAIVLVSGNELLKSRSDINFIWVPITIGCIFSFAVANCFLLIYEITIDTLFLCFCEDLERNDGIHRKYFMSIGLQKYLNDSERRELEIQESK